MLDRRIEADANRESGSKSNHLSILAQALGKSTSQVASDAPGQVRVEQNAAPKQKTKNRDKQAISSIRSKNNTLQNNCDEDVVVPADIRDDVSHNSNDGAANGIRLSVFFFCWFRQ